MTLAELAALLPLIEQFAPEVKQLIALLISTPEEKRQKIMERVNNAFNEALNNGRPGQL